jgi:hypothetical protein
MNVLITLRIEAAKVLTRTVEPLMMMMMMMILIIFPFKLLRDKLYQAL